MVGVPSSIGQGAGAAQSLAQKVLGLTGAAAKTWRDRLKPAAYTSPTGKRVTFAFEDLSRGFTIRGTQFDFPGVNDSYIQQSGYSSRKYPFACIFSGGQCDLLATQFEQALLETGTGRLEHPIYGTIDVVPLGDVDRSDALKTACNESIVTVTWFTTTGAIYPTSTTNAQNEIQSALDGFNLAAATAFASGVPNLKGVGALAGAIATIKGALKSVKGALAKASAAVSSVRKAFDTAFIAINSGMDLLIGTPLQLALQIENLIQSPGRALKGIESRLEAYANLADSIFGSSAGNPGKALHATSTLLANQTKAANDFHISKLFALSAVAGSVVSVTAQPIKLAFSTRNQVLSAAVAVAEQLDAATVWLDAGHTALAAVNTRANYQVDTGEAYAALQQLVALTTGYLVQASFSLLPEKAIVLDRPRTIIDLCAELYGSVADDKLDLLINTNQLSGDQILELAAGTRILYYPS